MMPTLRKTCTLLVSAAALAFTFAESASAEEPIIPPSIMKVSPAGMQRGTTATFTLEGRNLSDADQIIFDAPGISGKVIGITDVAEKIEGPRAGEDLAAQVPVGKKQTANLEITIAKDVAAGIHKFRIRTPLGTTNMATLAVGALPEAKIREKTAMASEAPIQLVALPATLVGNIGVPGSRDSVVFEGKAGEDVVFQVEASKLGSKLNSALVLVDSSGKTLAESGQNDNHPDAILNYHVPVDGKYTLLVTDRDRGGGVEYFYRLNAGALPYVSGVFPLGLRAGNAAEVSVAGVNLGHADKVKIEPPAQAQGWTTVPLKLTDGVHPVNEVKLEIGNEPEVMEAEPNGSASQAQLITIPATINGYINRGSERVTNPDEDYFRFHATKGEQISIGVSAARLGSKLDSVIEVLDSQGNELPRATIRCLNQTTTTLADRDSTTTGIRLVSTSDLHENDFLLVGDELNQVDFVPDQPDADTILKGMDDARVALLGTSSSVHAVNTPVYKVQILPADAKFPSNGLPVFHLNWRNDDGGPGYEADSKLDFVAPRDDDYVLHLKDVRGMDAPEFAYRLSLHEVVPDFRLRAEPANPNIPKGGSTIVTVSVASIRNYDGPIDVSVKGLPQGVSASPATIHPGQTSTVVVLTATQDAHDDAHAEPIEFVGRGRVNDQEILRAANADVPSESALQIVSIIPPPDVEVTTEAKDISIEPGKEVTITLHVDRRNGFKGVFLALSRISRQVFESSMSD